MLGSMDVCKELVVEIVQVALVRLVAEVVSECVIGKAFRRVNRCNADSWCNSCVGGVCSFTADSSSLHKSLKAFVLADWAVVLSIMWCGRV